MEAVAYILVLTLALGVIFFAIAFREPPRISKD
jgi:photosystem II PsbT protein